VVGEGDVTDVSCAPIDLDPAVRAGKIASLASASLCQIQTRCFTLAFSSSTVPHPLPYNVVGSNRRSSPNTKGRLDKGLVRRDESLAMLGFGIGSVDIMIDLRFGFGFPTPLPTNSTGNLVYPFVRRRRLISTTSPRICPATPQHCSPRPKPILSR